MLRRRILGTAAALLTALALVACTPGGADPTPTPTVLSEEEAYVAAEGAFRAYIDAQNDVVVKDPTSFEPLFNLSTGRQNAFDREQYSTWNAEDLQESGSIDVLWVDVAPNESSLSTVRLKACLDTSSVKLVNAAGISVRPNNGSDVAVWTVIVVEDDQRNEWLVEVTALPEGSEPCQAR